MPIIYKCCVSSITGAWSDGLVTKMATSGEPPLKKPIIDFEQCIKCQGEKWDSAKKTGTINKPNT